VAVGAVAGLVSVYGFSFASPWLKARGLTDTCGIFNLHFLPGLLGGRPFAALLSSRFSLVGGAYRLSLVADDGGPRARSRGGGASAWCSASAAKASPAHEKEACPEGNDDCASRTSRAAPAHAPLSPRTPALVAAKYAERLPPGANAARASPR
jgi:hypothetical protein